MTGYADVERIPPSIAILQKPFSLEQLRHTLDDQTAKRGPEPRAAAL
jgi:hypothetical protein